MEKLMITPKTKVSEMLDHYPQLEDLLIELAPQFKNLKNPILRKTIARVTTLSQAAIIGGVQVEDLVSQLRTEIGQNITTTIEMETSTYTTEKPDWFDESKIAETIDTRRMLNAGEHPIHEVLSAIKNLSDQTILKVVVPFIPAPMIDKSISLNHKHWLVEQSDHQYFLYFKK